MFSLSDNSIVVRMPQYRQVGRELHFMASGKPLVRLSDDEATLWEGLAAEIDVASLCDKHGSRARDIIDRMNAHGIVAILPGPAAANRREVLVIEPHCDDAALSIGGTMWQMRHQCHFTLVTLAGRSNYSSNYILGRDGFDADEISRVRAEEGRLFMRKLMGSYRALALEDAPLRYWNGAWDLSWYRRHRASILAFNGHRSGAAELQGRTAAVREIVAAAEFDELWFPLGIGEHTDHEMTRNAVLDVLIEMRRQLPGKVIRAYSDVPYDSRFPDHRQRIVASLQRCGAVMEEERSDISVSFHQKLDLLALFATQFKMWAITPFVAGSARWHAGRKALPDDFLNLTIVPEGRLGLRVVGQAILSSVRLGARVLWRRMFPRPAPRSESDTVRSLTEIFYRFTALPRRREDVEMNLDYPAVAACAGALRPWVYDARDVRCIRLLLRQPGGRSAEDIRYLLASFPAATIEVFFHPQAEAELHGLESRRVRLHRVGAGFLSWLALALRIAVSRPAHIGFVAGEAPRQARWLAMLWPLHRVVVAPRLDSLASGLKVACAGEQLPDVPATYAGAARHFG